MCSDPETSAKEEHFVLRMRTSEKKYFLILKDQWKKQSGPEITAVFVSDQLTN